MEIGAALCVRSSVDATSKVIPLTPEELEAQDERELALAECKAEVAGEPLSSEDNLSSDRDKDPPSPMRDDRFYAYERAGGFWHDQSVTASLAPILRSQSSSHIQATQSTQSHTTETSSSPS
eukprot:1856338-Pleurochrysis_carterae.AAC.1